MSEFAMVWAEICRRQAVTRYAVLADMFLALLIFDKKLVLKNFQISFSIPVCRQD